MIIILIWLRQCKPSVEKRLDTRDHLEGNKDQLLFRFENRDFDSFGDTYAGSIGLSNFTKDEAHLMAHPAGLEPATPWFEAKYSIQLNYGCEPSMLP